MSEIRSKGEEDPLELQQHGRVRHGGRIVLVVVAFVILPLVVCALESGGVDRAQPPNPCLDYRRGPVEHQGLLHLTHQFLVLGLGEVHALGEPHEQVLVLRGELLPVERGDLALVLTIALKRHRADRAGGGNDCRHDGGLVEHPSHHDPHAESEQRQRRDEAEDR